MLPPMPCQSAWGYSSRRRGGNVWTEGCVFCIFLRSSACILRRRGACFHHIGTEKT
jgi:hypothetical protein